MRVAVFSAKSYDREFFNRANQILAHQELSHQKISHQQDLTFFEVLLTEQTVQLAQGFDCVCAFVNDRLSAIVIQQLAQMGVRLIALRSAGFNHVDLAAARAVGVTVVRVPAYSPYAVAEHAIALILMLNRKLYRAYNRVRDDNFSLEGLTGFDLHGKTIGLIGTGKIGCVLAQIAQGFGMTILGYDPYPNPEFEAIGAAHSVDLSEIWQRSEIVSLHCPLTPENYHLINAETIAKFKPGMMLINTSRGGLVDTAAVIQGLKSGQIGYLGIDVYEQEASLFFEDLSDRIIQDDVFQLLQSFPNVVITAHQAFLTREALHNIAEVTLKNIIAFDAGETSGNEVSVVQR